MKIRILGNSIRIRLTQSEVKTLCKEGLLKSQTQFSLDPSETLIFGLELTDEREIRAAYSSNFTEIFLPKKMVDEWANSNQVGLENNMPLGDGSSLYILVEKDFKCLTDRDEDESDHFPNPSANC